MRARCGMEMLLFTGEGFLLQDGERRCQSFKVIAPSLQEAAFALNTAAGWLLVKPNEEESVLGRGLSVESASSSPEVHLKWPGQRGYEVITDLKRGRGALRLNPGGPKSSTTRVAQSVAKLKKDGGHRSTVRFSSAAYRGLVELSAADGLNHTDTLEKLILREIERRRARGRK